MKPILAACLLLLAVGGVVATDASDQEGCGCGKVAVDFYAEALCPFCRRFLTEIVADMMHSGFNDIMELRYVPWGNAMVRPNGKIECQHGPMECKLNRVLSCVIHHYPGQTQWFPFADCLEGSDSTHIDESLKKCADSAKMDLDLITTCAEGAEADKLQEQARNETAALQPPHQYVPWVVVNGIALGADYSNLPTYVCAAHRCERPKVCGKVPDDAALLKSSGNAGVSWPTQVAAS